MLLLPDYSLNLLLMQSCSLTAGFFTEGKAENVNLKRTERSHPLPFLGIVKEEELSGDELEEFIKDRYSSRVKHTPFDGSTNVQDDEFTEDGCRTSRHINNITKIINVDGVTDL